MLPYSPLHHLLLRRRGRAAGDDQRQRLRRADRLPRRRRAASGWAAIADAFLVHDRPIETRTDDSVRVRRRRAGRAAPLARATSRRALALPGAAPRARCWPAAPSSRARSAWRAASVRGSGHHIGDLTNSETLRVLRARASRTSSGCSRVAPEVVAHDLHPDYLSTGLRAASARASSCVGVQHHHAHLAACLAEHGETRARGRARSSTAPGSGPTARSGAASCSPAGSRGFERAGHLWPVRAARRRRGGRASRGGWPARGCAAARRADGRRAARRSRGRVDAGALARRRAARAAAASPRRSRRARAGCSTRSPRSAGCAPGHATRARRRRAGGRGCDPCERGAYPLPPARAASRSCSTRAPTVAARVRPTSTAGVGGRRGRRALPQRRSPRATARAPAPRSPRRARARHRRALRRRVPEPPPARGHARARSTPPGLRVLVPERLPPNDGGIASARRRSRRPGRPVSARTAHGVSGRPPALRAWTVELPAP